MSRNRKDWADKVVDALWAYRMAVKTPLGMSRYNVVYGKPCHLPIENERRVWWATKKLNCDLTEAGKDRRLQLSELEEVRAEAHESARSCTERAKLFRDKHILRKEFSPRIKVLLYDSKFYLFPGKLRSRWMAPCIVSRAFPYGVVEI